MLVLLQSPEGMKRLEEASTESGCALQHELVESFRKQRGDTVCGLASLAVVLTARLRSLSRVSSEHRISSNQRSPETILAIDDPDNSVSVVDEDSVYPMATQTITGTSRAVCGIVSEEKIRTSGMTLDQVRTLAEALPTTEKATAFFPVGDETDAEAITKDAAIPTATRKVLEEPESLRKLVVEALKEPSRRGGLILNYHMSTLGQVPFGGHLSPVAAYHQASDSLLVLDVWHTKTEPVWAPLCASGSESENGSGSGCVWEAISKIDPESGAPRGVLKLEHLPPFDLSPKFDVA